MSPLMALLGVSLCTPSLFACSPAPAGFQQPQEEALPTSQDHAPPPALRLELVASGLVEPTYVLSAPQDPDILIILEKAGRALVWREGQPQEQPFLDLRGRVAKRSEQGLLGMDFPPNFAERPLVYVHYSREDGATRVSRFAVDPESWTVREDSEEILLEVEQPYANHDGGQLEFGPDGYLYLGLGDGGAANDPHDAGQDLHNLLGKILRLDVSGDQGYTIPASNPFAGREEARGEVWAWGLRNPWRFSFDRLTGDLYIGDVGQNKWEEINFAPGQSKGGENYGWRLKEGTHEFSDQDGVPRESLVEPIHEYGHGGSGGHCSIVGGYVYRGSAIPKLAGWYFYGDTCSGAIGVLRTEKGVQVARHDLTAQLAPKRKLANLVSFGEDAAGELYAVAITGSVYRLVAALEGGPEPEATKE